ARDGRETCEASVERQALELPAGVDEHQSDAGEHGCQAGAEGDDQEEAERDAPERDRPEHHDEGGRTGEQTARNTERDEVPPADATVLMMVMVVRAAVMVMVMPAGERRLRARRGERDADRQDDEPRHDADPGKEPFG